MEGVSAPTSRWFDLDVLAAYGGAEGREYPHGLVSIRKVPNNPVFRYRQACGVPFLYTDRLVVFFVSGNLVPCGCYIY